MKNTTNKKFLGSSGFIYLSSFLLSTLMMAIILLSNGIYPGGPRTLLISDMQSQYVQFLGSLKYLGRGDNSLFFNWSHSLGGNNIGLFSYYLASPLSWITVFFDAASMPDAIYTLDLIKIGLCGLTFSIFLNKGIATQKNRPIIILFSCCYALMSYNILYSLCIMWLDEIILLPLVLLGLERMLDGKKGMLYFLTITACFLANYYLSYMVGIFAVIYLFYRIICRWTKGSARQYLGVCIRFAVNTVLGIGLAMPLLLPTALDLGNGRTDMAAKTDPFTFNFAFWKMFTKLLPSQYDTIQNLRGLPSIFCGSMIVILALLFFFKKQFTLREKITSAIILAFIFVSFWFVPLDKAWHGFHFPSWFPYRYAFTLSTMLLLLASRALEPLEISKENLGGLIYYIMVGYTFVELFFNVTNVLGGLDLECHYLLKIEYDSIVKPTIQLVNEIKEKDDGFFRVDKDYELGLDDSMLFDYNSLTHSCSTFNFKANQFTKELGWAQFDWWNMNYGSTILTDSLFGLKYRMAEFPLGKEWLLLDRQKQYFLYENPYALPIGFMVSDTNVDYEIDWQEDPFVNQNLLMQTLSGTTTSYFSPVAADSTTTDEDMTITFEAPCDGDYYVRVLGTEKKVSNADKIAFEEELAQMNPFDANKIRKKREAVLYVNDREYENYLYPTKYHNIRIGELTEGQKTKIRLDHHGLATTDGYYLATLNSDAMIETLQQMAQGGLQVTTHKNGTLTGRVTAAKGQALFTTIPYDKGFTVKVDGQKTEYHRFADTFLIIPLEEGEHEISISYISPGFMTGLMIAAIAFLFAIFFYLFPLIRAKGK